ncbi:hypothetical protein ACFLZB_03290 [Nanoarchaeota archaeon]
MGLFGLFSSKKERREKRLANLASKGKIKGDIAVLESKIGLLQADEMGLMKELDGNLPARTRRRKMLELAVKQKVIKRKQEELEELRKEFSKAA